MDEPGGTEVGYFVVYGAEGREAIVDPRRPAFVIGSDPRCDLRLADASVAPAHAVVSARNGDYFIRPRYAHVDVWVNGQRVGDLTRLNPGDTVQVGGATLGFCRDADHKLPTPSEIVQAAPPKPAVLPRYVPASSYAPPPSAAPAVVYSSLSAVGERAIYYPAPAEKPANVSALLFGYLAIIGVIGLFAYGLVSRLTAAPEAGLYSAYPPGTAQVLAFYADW